LQAAIAAVSARQPATLNILALSGGGQWGAYGAGFLNGWSALATAGSTWSPSDPTVPYISRQDIDMVTGVSTGAMQTTLVLVGSADAPIFGMPAGQVRAEADEILKDSYLNSNISALARKRNILNAALFHDSLYDVSVLEDITRQKADEYLPKFEQMPQRKRAYVGTLDIDDGVFYVADLKAMTDAPSTVFNESQKSKCLSESLLASSAIPIAFPPRFIDRHMFVDGGARFGLFSTIFLTNNDVVQAIRNKNLKVYVSVIINGNQSSNSYKTERGTVPNGLVDIAKASMSNGVDQIYKDSVYRTEMDLNNTFHSDYLSRYTYVSNDEIRNSPIAECVNSVKTQTEDEFDPRFMKCLYQLGYNKALSGRAGWQAFKDIPAIQASHF